jgi:serine protease Do
MYASLFKGRPQMLSPRFKLTHLIILFMFVVLTGCNPADNTQKNQAATPSQPMVKATATTPPTATPEPTPTPTEEPSLAVTSLDDVRLATIQIEAQGTFMDPEIGTMQAFAGLGSGFIIDESGLAVTNNHVVTGAAIVKVWVQGESEPCHARIVAVSECSDLAVIDIDGEGFRYLGWYEAPISVGTDVYAAGFPLGDPEYTLTRGIVSKEHANGQVSWASVEYVIEHDATINPGNSGGPLVSTDGEVIGINYAAYRDANQYFAITRDEALAIIDALSTGNSVDSIGVNGLAVTDGESLSGIWVSSVKSGSPSDFTGIQPGDILLKLEGLELATDGTMSVYCDIIRTHSAEDTLTVEVLRLETGEILKGQLNSQKLEVISTLEDEGASRAGEEEFVLVEDDYGVLEITVHTEWNEVMGSEWMMDGEVIGASIAACSDLNGFFNGWSTSGVFFGASHVLAQRGGYIQLLDMTTAMSQDVCEYEGRYDYDDGYYEGKYDVWRNCGGVGTSHIVVAAYPKADRTDHLVLVAIRLTSDLLGTSQGELIVDNIARSFLVTGDLHILTED